MGTRCGRSSAARASPSASAAARASSGRRRRATASSPPSRWRASKPVGATPQPRPCRPRGRARSTRRPAAKARVRSPSASTRFGQAPQGARDHRGIGVERGLSPDVEHDRRRKIRETLRKFKGDDGRIRCHSMPPVAGATTKQNLDGAGPAMRRGVCESPGANVSEGGPGSSMRPRQSSPSSSCTSTSSPAATLPVSGRQHDEAVRARHRRQDARALVAGRAHRPAARAVLREDRRAGIRCARASCGSAPRAAL